jgi:hypothetical protein
LEEISTRFILIRLPVSNALQKKWVKQKEQGKQLIERFIGIFLHGFDPAADF